MGEQEREPTSLEGLAMEQEERKGRRHAEKKESKGERSEHVF